MSKPYTYSTLRYQHDPVTQEFVNVGVVIFSKDEGILQAKCLDKYSRITGMFERIDGAYFRKITRFIESKINEIGSDLTGLFAGQVESDLEKLLVRVLPFDDSSIQFSPSSAGIADNLGVELEKIYQRHVCKYVHEQAPGRKSKTDVWRTFESALSKRKITEKFVRKKIVAPSMDYEFAHAAKNGVWHLCEAVTFDYSDEKNILTKASTWVGRATSLRKSNEDFKLHLLLGAPSDEKLRTSYEKALKILNDIPGEKDVFDESDAERFADSIEKDLAV